MSAIVDIVGREILDSRGNPTLEVDVLLEEAEDHAERVMLERQERGRLDDLGTDIYTLPYLPAGVDLGGLYRLASELRERGMV